MALTCMGYYLLPVYVENGDEVVVNPYKKIEERMAKLKDKKRYRN